MKLKDVFGDRVRAERGLVFVGIADYSGFVVETHLEDKSANEELSLSPRSCVWKRKAINSAREPSLLACP